MNQEYSEEEVKDISDREKKALEYLKENGLTPAAIIQKIRVGQNDTFVDQVIPYLRDTKYAKAVAIDQKTLN